MKMGIFEKIINVVSLVLGLCAIAGGLMFFLMVIGALVSGQITIRSIT